MSVFSAVILGIVQGLTEFLPVSSSGHLVLAQKIFGITEPALFFDTLLHAGTLLAVFVVLRRDILVILGRIIQPLTFFLIIATIPAVIAALVFKDAIENAFESGQFLGFAFLLTAALLAAAELLSRRGRSNTGETGLKKAEHMSWHDALVIGVLQAAAIIPGVSRSGATISGALSRRLDRDFAARFSFLLSIPAILGALVFQLKDLLDSGAAGGAGGGGNLAGGGVGGIEAAVNLPAAILPEVSVPAALAGALSAALVGFFAMKFMLKLVREKSLFGFAVYTAVLGALVLIDQFATHLVF